MPDLPLADRDRRRAAASTVEALEQLSEASIDDLDEVAAVVADHPTFLEGWAMLGVLAAAPDRALRLLAGSATTAAWMRCGRRVGRQRDRAVGAPLQPGVPALPGEPARRCRTRSARPPRCERIDEFMPFLDPDWDDANLTR